MTDGSRIIPNDGAPNEPSLRTLGTGANQALPGNTNVSGSAAVAAEAATRLAADNAEAATRGTADTNEAAARAAVQTNLNTHTALTTSAHGGIVASSDSRLTDQRTPTDGSVTPAKFASAAIDPAANVAGARTLGTGAQQAMPGNTTIPGATAVGSGTITIAQGQTTATINHALTNPIVAIYPSDDTLLTRWRGSYTTTTVTVTLDEPAPASIRFSWIGIQSAFTGGSTPQGTAGGSLAGTYPAPSIAAGAVGVPELNPAIWANGHGVGAFSARPGGYTVLDAGKMYLATDDAGGTPYLWDGFAWQSMLGFRKEELNARAAPYFIKFDSVTVTDGQIDPATPTKFKSLSTVFSAADVGKIIAIEAAGVGETGSVSMTNGSNLLTRGFVQIVITANGGTFTITFNGQTTSALAWNASAATVQTALESLSSFGVGKVGVTLAGTTYTVTIKSGAPSGDISLLSASGAGLTGAINSAAPTAKVQIGEWYYGDVGRKIEIPGAGAAGGTLTGYIGAILIDTRHLAVLYDSPPNIDGTTGNVVNASTTVVGATYHELNAGRFTIASIDTVGDPAGHTVILNTSIDSGVTQAHTALRARWGTDNTAAHLQLCADAVTQNKDINYGSGGECVITQGPIMTLPAGQGINITGRCRIRSLVVDSDSISSRYQVGGTGNTASTRAKGVLLQGLDYGVPFANKRGFGLAGRASATTGPGGFFLSKISGLVVDRCTVEVCYGAGINVNLCSQFVVTRNRVYGSWADGIDITNSNQNGGLPCANGIRSNNRVEWAGDGMFTMDTYVASAVMSTTNQGERTKHILDIGNVGYRNRQLALCEGFSYQGGDDLAIIGNICDFTEGGALAFKGTRGTNEDNTWTVSTPSTGAQVVNATAQPNLTAGLTQMRVFKNDGSDTYWVGDVTAVSNDGLTITLAASSGYATTCPFTGANSYAQWGANTSDSRFGVGGCNGVTIDGFRSDTSCTAPNNDSTRIAAIRCQGGSATTEAIRNVRGVNIDVVNSWESGFLTDSYWQSSKSNVSNASTLVRDIRIEGTAKTVGISSLTGDRPWCGLFINVGSNMYFKLYVEDTDDEAWKLNDIGIHVTGTITLDIVADNVGRTYTTGSPLNAAGNPGTTPTCNLQILRFGLKNSAGTAGGTQYVCAYQLGKIPAASATNPVKRGDVWCEGITVGGVNAAITTALCDESTAGRWFIVTSPIEFRGKGSPEGVVPAPVGARYQRSDGSASTCLYIKESGTGNTGWVAYGSGQTSLPAPELDILYGANLEMSSSAAALVVGTVYFIRLKGNGLLSNILVFPIATLTGNTQVGVYANTGTGFAAKPTGNPLSQSVSTAVANGAGGAGAGLTANTRNPIALAVPQTVTHLNAWFAIQVDSASTTWQRIPGLGNLGLGYMMTQTGSYVAGTLPTAGSPIAAAGVWPMVLGT